EIVVALPPGESAPDGTVGAPGGEVRSGSVRSALAAAGDGDPVVVHDAARPLAPPDLFARALAELEQHPCEGAVAAAPVTDTVKEATTGGWCAARWSATVCGRCRRPRPSAARRWSVRWTWTTRSWPRPPTM